MSSLEELLEKVKQMMEKAVEERARGIPAPGGAVEEAAGTGSGSAGSQASTPPQAPRQPPPPLSKRLEELEKSMEARLKAYELLQGLVYMETPGEGLKPVELPEPGPAAPPAGRQPAQKPTAVPQQQPPAQPQAQPPTAPAETPTSTTQPPAQAPAAPQAQQMPGAQPGPAAQQAPSPTQAPQPAQPQPTAVQQPSPQTPQAQPATPSTQAAQPTQQPQGPTAPRAAGQPPVTPQAAQTPTPTTPTTPQAQPSTAGQETPTAPQAAAGKKPTPIAQQAPSKPTPQAAQPSPSAPIQAAQTQQPQAPMPSGQQAQPATQPQRQGQGAAGKPQPSLEQLLQKAKTRRTAKKTRQPQEAAKIPAPRPPEEVPGLVHVYQVLAKVPSRALFQRVVKFEGAKEERVPRGQVAQEAARLATALNTLRNHLYYKHNFIQLTTGTWITFDKNQAKQYIDELWAAIRRFFSDENVVKALRARGLTPAGIKALMKEYEPLVIDMYIPITEMIKILEKTRNEYRAEYEQLLQRLREETNKRKRQNLLREIRERERYLNMIEKKLRELEAKLKASPQPVPA